MIKGCVSFWKSAGRYIYAAEQWFLPPYFENSFSKLNLERIKVEDAKPIFVFDAESELRFFQKADDSKFPIHLILAKTGLRTGELIHLLLEEVDLKNGWLHVRNKHELHWKVKTRRERSVPLIKERVAVMRRVIGNRTSGPVFIRHLLHRLFLSICINALSTCTNRGYDCEVICRTES